MKDSDIKKLQDVELQILKDFGLNEDYYVGIEEGKTENKK